MYLIERLFGLNSSNLSSGFSQIKNLQDLCRRSISKERRASCNFSNPSEINNIIGLPERTRLDQCLLKYSIFWVMRVPPDQSSVLLATAFRATSMSRVFMRVILVRWVPKIKGGNLSMLGSKCMHEMDHHPSIAIH